MASKIRLDWQDYAMLAMLALLLGINIYFLSQLKQLPSPIFGGDYYNHLGSMEHIYQGGSVFESGQFLGEIQWVPWLYHVLVVTFAKVTFMGPMMANIWFNLVAVVAGVIIIYLFILEFTGNKNYSLLAVLWQAAHFPLYKYSPFSFYIVLPLFFWMAYRFIKRQDVKSAIILGFAYGIASLSNTHAFILATFFMVFMAGYMAWGSVNWHTKKINLKHLTENAKLAGIVIAIGVMIAMLWWFKPIFVYHAQTPNDMQVYGFKTIQGLGGMLGIVTEGLFRELFDFGNVFGFVFKIGIVVGILLLAFMKNRKPEHQLLIIATLSSLFGLVSHFITTPIIGSNLAPMLLFNASMVVTGLLLFIFALDFIIRLSDGYRKEIGIGILVLVALIFAYNVYNHYTGYNNEYWLVNAGRQPLAPFFIETREWTLANTGLNDVFLTTNEDGFAFNALTGRKLVTYRRTHAPSYADMNQRMLDSAVMLYGSNDEARRLLFEKYSVDYLYWTPRWIQNEFHIDASGNIQGFFDPLMVDYSPEREQYLQANNVSYRRTQWYLDPAWQPTFPKRDVLVVFPSRGNVVSPWSDTLDKHLTLAKEVSSGGQIAARIYKVNP